LGRRRNNTNVNKRVQQEERRRVLDDRYHLRSRDNYVETKI
jgi:hypothetical protein